nr:putative DUF3237 domain-containing protein [uncultured bacterium]
MFQITPITRSVWATLVLAILAPGTMVAQTTSISTEYLMTMRAPLEAPQFIDESLLIFNLRDGGWAKGPAIEGTLIKPGADWLQVFPDGTVKLDVRLTIEADDGALIYMTYNGIAKHSDISLKKYEAGEGIAAKEMYFVTAPTMRTSSKKYGWLNDVQLLGKMTKLLSGADGFVEYDIFVVR